MALLNPNETAKFVKSLELDKEHIDTGSGSLFGIPDKRVPGTSRLFLVISSGGSGQAAIQKAMMTAKKKMRDDFSVYTKFLVIDSADQELDRLERKGINTLNISSPGIQNRFPNRGAFYRRFVPRDGVNLAELAGNGSNRTRMNSKIKLYDYNGKTTNDQALRDKINSLFNNEWAPYHNLPVDIMILTGLSGGNGSGTFIDLAVIARSACPDPNNVQVFGFLMLPDTVES